MPKEPTVSHMRARLIAALREAAVGQAPDARIDGHGYFERAAHNLLQGIDAGMVKADLDRGDGNEWETKVRAPHSSSALAVNAFAPLRNDPGDLLSPHVAGRFRAMAFERKCPTGLRGGRAPNLDVVLEGDAVVGIESKLLEYLTPHRASFSEAYAVQIRDRRRDSGYFAEMQEMRRDPRRYRHLDAAQLVKHAFGLARSFAGRPVTLLYLYWEPVNPDAHPVFARHRAEIAGFAERVAGSAPRFQALAYPALWSVWLSRGGVWRDHAEMLRARYGVAVG